MKNNDLKNEQWLPIANTKNYEISDMGRVRRNYLNGKTRILTPSTNGQTDRDYLFIIIDNKKYYIHHLVLETFVGERPEKHDCDHKDNNRNNNALINLRYLHQSINRSHKGESHGYSKLTNRLIKTIKHFYSQGYTQQQIADIIEVSRSTISHVLTGRTWSHII
jgi:hypothetical protein